MASSSAVVPPPSASKIKVAVIHASLVYVDKQATMAKVLRLIEEASSESDMTVVAVEEAYREAGVAVVLGVLEHAPNGGHTLLDSQLPVNTDGRLVDMNRKLQPTHFKRMV